ncbi:hypothetical protein OIDMADRAFT_62440 [Oidiodendron maius Zn]|uniref:Uncharacterized protein n=1 Tax=Oidiodendron maius (strain Zn) TaxID=913774 RepID=A0A0C3GPX0_OIDMZ|nr:hypothetical protein OIDMADRAFT_62440 [Oidiodendron maius Zn]
MGIKTIRHTTTYLGNRPSITAMQRRDDGHSKDPTKHLSELLVNRQTLGALVK